MIKKDGDKILSIPVDEEKKKKQQKVEEEQVAEETKVEPEVEVASGNDKALAEEYLNLARVIQADFDNYRKRSVEQIERARIDGISTAVELMLPSLDAFKKVKENIKDKNTLDGINMLEKAFNSSLEKIGVEKIDAVGLQLDPNVHNVLAVAKNEEKEDGVILEEYQAGYKMKGKVIRASQVLVNKLN